MQDAQIRLSGLWVALMLTYLLGDVLRIYAGDVTPGEIRGVQLTQLMVLGIALVLVLPIVMVVVTLTVGSHSTAGPTSSWRSGCSRSM